MLNIRDEINRINHHNQYNKSLVHYLFYLLIKYVFEIFFFSQKNKLQGSIKEFDNLIFFIKLIYIEEIL